MISIILRALNIFICKDKEVSVQNRYICKVFGMPGYYRRAFFDFTIVKK